MNKEECEKALARIINDDYYFENDPYEEDKASAFDKDVDTIEQLIKEHFEPKPYKFEDLKVGMWVYDSKSEYEDWAFIKITKILSKDDCEYLYDDKNKQVFFDNTKCSAREFEENRFFPVRKANEVSL